MTIREKVILWFWKGVEKQDNKRIAGQTPVSGIKQITDIPYINDGHRGRLFDVYFPEGTEEKLPVIIDIHGGGFMYGYKELNKYYNLYLSSLGYTVYSLSYRLAPEVRFDSQVRDIMAAYAYINDNAENYPGDMNNIFVTGDSAGAMLTAYTALVNVSEELQKVFKTKGSGLNILALGLTSGAFQVAEGKIKLLAPAVLGKNYKKKEIYKYLDYSKLKDLKRLPPSYIVTSKQDFIRSGSLYFAKLLAKNGIEYVLHDWQKVAGKRLDHVFSVTYWNIEEGKQTIKEMTDFFKAHMNKKSEKEETNV